MATKRQPKLSARYRVTLVMDAPLGSKTLPEAFEEAANLTVSQLVTVKGELLDCEESLQGVTSSAWLED